MEQGSRSPRRHLLAIKENDSLGIGQHDLELRGSRNRQRRRGSDRWLRKLPQRRIGGEEWPNCNRIQDVGITIAVAIAPIVTWVDAEVQAAAVTIAVAEAAAIPIPI